jgi:hypothetical protein
MHGFWQNFWFGMTPAEFLRTELHLTPARRILAIRLFITLMIVAFLSVTLRPPSIVALSFSFVMMLGPTMMDYTMTLVSAWKLMKLEVVAIVLSIISLAMWGDQPWFLVPWSYAMITVLLFISRVTGTPTIPPMLYVFAVLYNPEHPDQNVYGALWMLPTLGLLAFGTSIIAQLVLWPQDPEKLLMQTLDERLEVIARMLDRLAGTIEGSDSAMLSKPDETPTLGNVSRQFTLLSHAEMAHSTLKSKHAEWIDFIVEMDTWFNIASKLNHLVWEANPKLTLTGPDRARIQAIAEECRQLQRAFLANQAPSAPLPCNHPSVDVPSPSSNDSLSLLLHRLEHSSLRASSSLALLSGPVTLSNLRESEPEAKKGQTPPLFWLSKQFWLDNMDALHYGMKFSLGVMICLFLVQAFRWPGIDTAILTCVIVAQTSMGADYRKSVMRIMGASLGGFLAYVFIIVLEPALDTIAGFMLTIAPVMWLSAWVGSGSPRIAYVGTQIGYAFAHAVLPGYGPVFHLESARDRVLGILLGITVVGVINYVIWPQRSERMVTKKLAASMRTMGKFLKLGVASPPDRQSSAAMLKSIDSGLQSVLTFLENAQIEPGSNQADASTRLNTLGLMLGTLHTIARLVQARHHYHVGKQFRDQIGPLIELQTALDISFSQALLGFADRLENKSHDSAAFTQSSYKMLEELTRQARAGNVSKADEAHLLNAYLDLDKILIDAIDELGSMLAGIESH